MHASMYQGSSHVQDHIRLPQSRLHEMDTDTSNMDRSLPLALQLLQFRVVLPLNHFSHLLRFLPAVVVAPRLTVTATSRVSIVDALFVLYTL